VHFGKIVLPSYRLDMVRPTLQSLAPLGNVFVPLVCRDNPAECPAAVCEYLFNNWNLEAETLQAACHGAADIM
jgi:hypothetical protein